MPAHHRFHTHAPARPSPWNAHGLTPRPPAGGRALFGFDDRRTAGRILAEWLAPVADDDAVVVAIAGGGVLVADEVAHAFGLPLDVLVVEPVTVAGFPFAQLGAVAEDGTVRLDDGLATELGVRWDALVGAADDRRPAVARRAFACHGGERPLDVTGRTVILVDEALDGGIVAATAADALRGRGAGHIVAAVPVGDRPSVRRVDLAADEVVAVLMPGSAGPREGWYRDFPPVSDADVAGLVALGVPVG